MNLNSMRNLIQKKRGQQSIRQAAKGIGISAATLSRVERGYSLDLETFVLLCEWLGGDPASYLGIDGSKPIDVPEDPIAAAIREQTAQQAKDAAERTAVIREGEAIRLEMQAKKEGRGNTALDLAANKTLL